MTAWGQKGRAASWTNTASPLTLASPAWTESAAARAAAVLAALPRRAYGFPDLLAHIVLLAFGTELVPLDGWKTAGGAGGEMALRRLLPRAEVQMRALVIGLLMRLR